MNTKKIGFIGCGNMAQAMIASLVGSANIEPDNILASDMNQKTLDHVSSLWGIATTQENSVVAKESNILIIAVKPQLYEKIMNEIKDHLNGETIVVSIAPGKTLDFMASFFPPSTKIVRTMPNTPVMVGEGMIALSPNKFLTKNDEDAVVNLFLNFGKVEMIEEHLMDAVVGVSGSSPAYVFVLIEAMADAGVLAGMPRDKAYTFAAQAVMGSAKMVLESNKHPAELKDMVCSPGGTTIEAVFSLEESGFRSGIMKAIHKCVKKAKNM